jgi:hypothetical protein
VVIVTAVGQTMATVGVSPSMSSTVNLSEPFRAPADRSVRLGIGRSGPFASEWISWPGRRLYSPFGPLNRHIGCQSS